MASPMVTDEKPQPTAAELQTVLLGDLNANVGLLEKAVNTKENRFMVRVIRSLPRLRHRLTLESTRAFVDSAFGNSSNAKGALQAVLSGSSVSDAQRTQLSAEDNALTPEVRVYVQLMVAMFLLDQKSISQAVLLSEAMLEYVRPFSRHTLEPLAHKVFSTYARSYELAGRLSDTRATLLALHRTSSLRHDEEGQAVLLNLLLRSYIEDNLYDQADKLVSKSTFPEKASNNQGARYMYYLGRIRSVQLEYDEAYRVLTQALRKAPQNTATGFKCSVYKLLTIVELLKGEMPERATFRLPAYSKALAPYFSLTRAVRVGELTEFRRVTEQHQAIFQADKLLTLIQRLRHNVIKTGLRKINSSYRQIHLADICARLSLDSAEDAEFIVAKAIHEHVIDASINHEQGFIRSKENVDVYATNEPQELFAQRINFCLNIHNEAVKAMRFPDNQKRKLENAAERQEREKEEKEIIGALEDGADDPDGGEDF